MHVSLPPCLTATLYVPDVIWGSVCVRVWDAQAELLLPHSDPEQVCRCVTGRQFV